MSTEKIRPVIKDLLDFSRIGAKASLQQVDCNKVLKHVVADLMTAIGETKADIQFAELPVIAGYPTELKLLFQNLLINAMKFRKKETNPQIKIAAQKLEGYWQFSVSDNGIGIDRKNSERIFDIFQRLHSRNDYEGSGIGLAHCKKIVELHHGKIWVESVPGEGSTFFFKLLIRKEFLLAENRNE